MTSFFYNFFSDSQITPYNIRLTLAFPPDTNTPGFEEEQKTKVMVMIILVRLNLYLMNCLLI